MNSTDRVYTALYCEEPDTVPVEDGWWPGAEKIIMKPLLEGKSFESDIEKAIYLLKSMNYDTAYSGNFDMMYEYAMGALRVIGETDQKIVFKDSWGVTWVELKNSHTMPVYVDSPIKDYDQFDDFEFPEQPFIEKDVENLRWTVKAFKDANFFVCGQTLGPLEVANFLRGRAEVWKDAIRNPSFLKKLFQKGAEYNIKNGKIQIEQGIHAIVIAEDLGYEGGTFFSPKLLRELWYPYFETEVQSFKRIGVPVRLHSCGDVRALVPDFVNAGVNSLEPLQPKANMDLRWLKENFGDRLCLIGNVDVGGALMSGSPEDVANEVKNKIDIAAPGGGYIIHSSHSLMLNMPFDNIMAVVKAARKYGKYN